MTISGTIFRCARPLNIGVRLIKVSFKINKGNKFGDFGYCPLNRGCPLNTVSAQVSLYISRFRNVCKRGYLWMADGLAVSPTPGTIFRGLLS